MDRIIDKRGINNYMKWLNKLERKFGRYAIHNLMYYLIILYAVGFIVEVFGNNFYTRMLSLDVAMVLRGQVWRLFTFIIGPPNTSLFFIFLSLYFYYMMGSVLERAWGAFRFNLYMISGWLLHIVAAFVIYFGFGVNFSITTTYYLNMSLFLAFATLMPNAQVLLFYFIPIKIKWVAYVDMLYFALTIFGGLFSEFLPLNILIGLMRIGIMATPEYAIVALLSLLNFIVFYVATRNYRAVSPKEMKRKAEYKHKIHVAQKATKHKCAVCGKTEKDGEDIVFRFCSKCDGAYEYCSEHLYTHKHVTKQ